MLQVLLISLVVLLAGCSINKDMKETKDNAKDMKKISESLKTSQEYLTILARAGSSGAFTVDQFEKIKKAESVSEKLSAATTYFAGMEYQYWLGWSQDTQELRESMWAKDLELFFSHVDELLDNTFPVKGSWWTFGYKPDDKLETLGVISVAMSKIAVEQERMTKKFGIKSVSAYDMIKEGLKYKADKEAGKPVPAWALKVLESQKTAVYLLQLRHNFFPLVVLARMTSIKNNPTWFVVKSLFADFDIDLNNYDSSELGRFSELLDKGIDAYDYLATELCIKPELMKLPRHLYLSARIIDNKAPYAQKFLKDLRRATHLDLNVVASANEPADEIDLEPAIALPDGTTQIPAGF